MLIIIYAFVTIIDFVSVVVVKSMKNCISNFIFFAFLTFIIPAYCADSEWWQHTIVYQIYPRSFQDSDGDGTGDIKGIQSRLPYLKEIGAETIWISPIYKSPMVDFGYDISDFTDIDPIFGSLEDFSNMVQNAHDLDIKIVMDFVPNHSSDQHQWFLKSVAKEEPYTDYYIWKDPSGFDGNGNPIPPNNWLSVFRFTAWKYVEERGQFYYHAFTPEQPDLNYRNPAVVEEMKNVIRFWVGDMAIDGFRMDAVPYLYEDPGFLDEPKSNKTDDPNSYDYLEHIYTFNLPEVYDMIKDFNNVLSEYEIIDGFDRVVMVEALSDSLSTQELMKYYESCDFAFNFNFVVHLDPKSQSMASDIEFLIDDWMKNMPAGKTANWVLDNHDNPRVGSKFGPEFIDPLNMISMMLPGVAVTYNGDEIGMLNTNISYEDTVDPAGCNCGPENYQECSRDPERTPMQWSSEKNAGFSTSDTTWLPVNPNYVTLNVQDQNQAKESHLKLYKAISQFRNRYEVLKYGRLGLGSYENILFIQRHLIGAEDLGLIANFGNEKTTVPNILRHDDGLEILLRSTNSTNPNTIPGNIIDGSDIFELEPYEAIIVEYL